MANTLLTIAMITREALRILENNLTFTKQVNREYSNEFGRDGAKIGSVLNVRKPVRYVNSQGQGLVLQDVTETSVPVALNVQYQRAFTFSSSDLALSIDDFAKRFITPAIASMANQIDFNGLTLYNQVWNTVGTPGTVPNALLTYLQAGVALDNNAAPMDGERCIVINPLMQSTIVDNLKGLFQSSSKIAEQYEKGKMGESIGFEWYMDQNVHLHTVGPLGGSPTVNTTSVDGATTIASTGWTSAAASRLNQGDVFTIDNVFSVNPQNRQSTGQLQQFVVTAPFSSASNGTGTISISPAINSTGPFQNVDSLPQATANINVLGAASTQTPQGLAFHPDAFTFANSDLPLPGGVDMAERAASKQVGLSIRLVRAYDINTDRFPCRLDLLGGWAAIYPELACRIAS